MVGPPFGTSLPICICDFIRVFFSLKTLSGNCSVSFRALPLQKYLSWAQTQLNVFDVDVDGVGTTIEI